MSNQCTETVTRDLQSLCDRLGEIFNTDDTPDELSTEAREAIEELWEERDRLRKDIARLTEIADGLLNHCDKDGGECHVCSVICCPLKDPLHFHHDGCPSCSQEQPNG